MGAGPPAYQVTETALYALMCTLAGELRGARILVTAVCPGWVAADMGGAGAPRSVHKGAAGIAWAATPCPTTARLAVSSETVSRCRGECRVSDSVPRTES